MADHVANRTRILESLRRELVGPSPQGKEIACKEIRFEKAEESYGPWRQADSGEEILQRDAPTKRYGVGVLYPLGTTVPEAGSPAAELVEVGGGILQETAADREEQQFTARVAEAIDEIADRSDANDLPETDDFDLSGANAYRPSSMAISFLAEFPDGAILHVVATGGRYERKSILVAGEERQWWLRKPITLSAAFSAGDLTGKSGAFTVKPSSTESVNTNGLEVRIEVYSRPWPPAANPYQRLITVCLVNRCRNVDGQSIDSTCLFQSRVEAHVASPMGSKGILPYPEALEGSPDDEEQSIALLYRHTPTYATGHGCAAGWDVLPGDFAPRAVIAECLPTFETPSITPDVMREDGTAIEVPMRMLAGLDSGTDGFAALVEVIDLYEGWIARMRSKASTLSPQYAQAAQRHLMACQRCADRMRSGLEYLRSNQRAQQAFKLANRAMLIQQIRSRRQARIARFDESQARLMFSEPYSDADERSPASGRGSWRAFQIAFLLMSARSAGDGADPDRLLAELIWFPTGGGKTEAYLGLAAYCMFLRRLKQPTDAGVEVLMRYTLRLLTAQQFQRASALICAMEHIRQENPGELGTEPYTIGIWVGRDTTPNSRQQAKDALRKLKNDPLAANPFLIDRCPWCGAQMGPLAQKGKSPRGRAQGGGARRKGRQASWSPTVIGYTEQAGSVVFACPDTCCRFSQVLPVSIIDEEIYSKPPTLIIGTVDKFAMLAWRPDARSLFGIGLDGERRSSPPGLIIQDELHLISGPLGSMVGLYEAAIEELCTDRRCSPATPPKIVSSTATIRRFEHQILAIYGRRAALFPPSGIDVGDSFFATYARGEDGALKPGRMYVGVHAPGLGSLQTVQARTFAALLQSPIALPQNERDPWWSLLVFFNSLRELGTTLSLFQSDIPDYLKVIRYRTGTAPIDMRRPWNVRELTGRLRDHEIPRAIADLEMPCGSGEGRAVDVCLASNIIEVGVDIDRLSLISVLGQPKSTSQYIQVTGRVGRSWWTRPGLVVTIYSPTKPRDRSHFEKFRSYHERLYAQVEPTSVTPFSPPALDRALHAVLSLYVRQAGTAQMGRSPYPFPQKIVNRARGILRKRVELVDCEEVENFERVSKRRAAEWTRWQRTHWSKWDMDGPVLDPPLLREAGAYVNSEWKRITWATPMSMRNVDAECQAEITQLYLNWGSSDDA